MAFTAEYCEREPTRAEIDTVAGPLVVEFGTPWCGHCLAVQQTLAELMKQHPDVRHIKIYDGKGQPLGRSFRVKLWPTLVFIYEGKVVFRAVRPDESEIAEGMHAITRE